MIKYIPVAARAAKFREPCFLQATPKIGVYLSSMAGCHRVGVCQGGGGGHTVGAHVNSTISGGGIKRRLTLGAHVNSTISGGGI